MIWPHCPNCNSPMYEIRINYSDGKAGCPICLRLFNEKKVIQKELNDE